MVKLPSRRVFFCCIEEAQAQKILSDTKGRSALLNESVGSFKKREEPLMFLLNTANSSLNGNYLWEDPEKSSAKFGIDFGAKAANGALSVLESLENAREFTGNVFMSFPLGRDKEEMDENPTPKQQMMVELSICRGTYNFIKSDMSTATGQKTSEMSRLTDKTRTETRTLPSMFVYYNRGILENLLAGVSVGYVRQNNYASLDTRQIVESQPLAQTEDQNSSDMETNVILNQLTSREGDYEEFDALQVNADMLFTSDIKRHKIGLSLFFRYTYRHNVGSLFEPGFGIFSLKESIPPEKGDEDKTGQEATEEKTEAKTQTDKKTVKSDTDLVTGIPPAKKKSEPTSTNGTIPPNMSLLEKGYSPWKIVYGLVGQWNADLDEFRIGFVAGYNF